MKVLVTVLSLVFASLSVKAQTSSGQTVSQRTAKEMASILNSPKITDLLTQNDGVGNLTGIEYVRSGRASFGPASYALNFRSFSGPTPQICVVDVDVNMETLEVISVSQGSCK